MDINEKAKMYAEGKALSAFTFAIEQAYADGYKDGLKHYENERLESFVDGIEYKDLDLTSGKKWASGYVMNKGSISLFSYKAACKFNLPTKDDFEELCKECRMDNYSSTQIKGIRFTGKNGKIIELPYIKVPDIKDDIFFDCISFWLKNPGENTEKEYARINSSKIVMDAKTFMGYKLPILLVK